MNKSILLIFRQEEYTQIFKAKRELEALRGRRVTWKELILELIK